MRPVPVFVVLSIFFASLSTPLTTSCVTPRFSTTPLPQESYRWIRAVGPKTPGWPRWVKPVLGFGDRLWMIDSELSWNSANGVHWRSAKNNGLAAVKPGDGRVFFKNKLWLMGGMKSWAEFANDIWSSADGVNWQLVMRNAAWAPRRDHLLIEFDGKLWLMGGSRSSGQLNVTPTSSFHDVWNSADGVNWTRITEDAPWSTLNGGHAIVFNDQMWVFGGGSAWYSVNGKDWREAVRGNTALQRRAHGVALFNHRIWVYGGMRGELMGHEVWSSGDGIHWARDTEHAPWFPRGAEYSIVFQDKLWIYGGKTGVDYDHADDIWYMARR